MQGQRMGYIRVKYLCKNKLILLLRENQHWQRMGARAYKNNYAQVLSILDQHTERQLDGIEVDKTVTPGDRIINFGDPRKADSL
jgi:hypothetical protein